MKPGNTKSKIDHIRQLIEKKEYDTIIIELISVNKQIDDQRLKDQITHVCSKHYELQQKELLSSNVNVAERENYLRDILSVTDEAEKFISTLEIPNTINISTFTNENVLNILSFFDKQTKEKKLTEAELADVLDTKVKLYDSIFKDFDSQLETTYKGNLPGVLFDRIILFEQIQKPDFDIVQSIRNNKVYSSRDRSLIVSGITISLLNRFDSAKMHLLIDFLTDFEEEVWQKALVGLILSLIRFDNRISLFPEIARRLYELRDMKTVQNSISFIEKVLRYRLFSPKDNFIGEEKSFIKKMRLLLGDSITFTVKELNDIKILLKESPAKHEDEIVIKLFNRDKIDELYKKLDGQESVSISITELFDCCDFETYLSLYELNPFQLNLNTDLYKNPRNWFIPFEDDENLRNILVNNFQVPDIDIVDFIDVLKNNAGIGNIDKHFIVINMGSFSDDFIRMIYFASRLENYYIAKDGISKSELTLIRIIRELYRFQQLSITSQIKNIFEDKLNIYNKSLLEKITDKVTSDKIKAKYLFDQELYRDSLEVLKDIPVSEHDSEILDLFINNYIGLDEDAEVIPYLDKFLTLLEENPNVGLKAYWYAKVKRLYDRLDNQERYMFYLEKETLIKEIILEKSFAEDEFAEEIRDKAVDLAGCYYIMAISYWNNHNNFVKSFNYLAKYIDIYFEIPELDDDFLQQELQPHRESISTLFKIFSTFENQSEIIKLLNEQIKQEIDPQLFEKIYELFSRFQEIFDMVIDRSILEISKNNSSIQDHMLYLYNMMFPVFVSVTEKHPLVYENMVVPFVLDNRNIEVTFPIDNFFAEKENLVLERLISSLFKVMKAELYNELGNIFLDNLYTGKSIPHVSVDIITDYIYNNLLNLEIPSRDNNKDNSFEEQGNISEGE